MKHTELKEVIKEVIQEYFAAEWGLDDLDTADSHARVADAEVKKFEKSFIKSMKSVDEMYERILKVEKRNDDVYTGASDGVFKSRIEQKLANIIWLALKKSTLNNTLDFLKRK